MLPTVPMQLFLYISKILQLPSPTLLLKEDETIPMEMCNGSAFPIACIQYRSDDSSNIQELLKSEVGNKKSQIFISDRDHQDLMTNLSQDMSFFDRSKVLVVPFDLVNKMHLRLRLDSRVLLYKETQSGGYEVFESYAIKGGTPITKLLFVWSPGLELPLAIDFLASRSNLQEVKLKNSWFNSTPLVILAQGNDYSNAVGFSVDILNDLQSQLNFTYESVSPQKGKWGWKLKNGSWSGLVGMLLDKKIDMTAVGTLVNIKRHGVVDSLLPFFSMQYALLSPSANKPKLNAWEYAYRFSLSVWLTTIAFLILAAILFSISSRQSVGQGLTLMARLFLQLGYDVPTTLRVASRMLLLISALTFMLIFMYYESELTATMTSKPPKLGINSFEDVIGQEYTVVTQQANGLAEGFLKSAPKDSAMRWIYDNQYMALNDFKPLRRVLEMEKTLLWAPYSPFKTKPYEKRLVNLEIRETVVLYLSLVLQKDSEFTEVFNYHLLKMMENGKMEAMKLRWMTSSNQEFGISNAIQLGYENVMDPFACCALGVIVAAWMSLLEYLFVKVKHNGRG